MGTDPSDKRYPRALVKILQRVSSSGPKNNALLNDKDWSKRARNLHVRIKNSSHYSSISKKYIGGGNVVRPLGVSMDR